MSLCRKLKLSISIWLARLVLLAHYAAIGPLIMMLYQAKFGYDEIITILLGLKSRQVRTPVTLSREDDTLDAATSRQLFTIMI
jgi:hypothetical protein